MPRWIDRIRGRAIDNLYWPLRGLSYTISGVAPIMPINPTDEVMPYRIDSNTFGDSNLIRFSDSVTEARNVDDGTISQTFTIYNFAGNNDPSAPTDYERLQFQFDPGSDRWRIRQRVGGTGTDRDFYFSNIANVSFDGNILPDVNGDSDIGSTSKKWRQLYIDETLTAGGTTGDQTIDKAAGSVNFAALATSLTVTCDKCTDQSIVICTVLTDDATGRLINVVPDNGEFTINVVAPTGEMRVGFLVLNQ